VRAFSPDGTGPAPEDDVQHQDAHLLTLQWTPQRSDYVEALRARRRDRKAWRRVLVLTLVGVVLLIFAAAIRADPTTWVLLAFYAMLLLVLAVLAPHLGAWSLWRNPVVRRPAHAQVDPRDGITVAAQSTSQHPWTAVHSILETDGVFVVQLNGFRKLKPFFLLPKRGVADPAQVDQLRALLTSGVAAAQPPAAA
jgi:hypothetical protein